MLQRVRDLRVALFSLSREKACDLLKPILGVPLDAGKQTPTCMRISILLLPMKA